MLKFRWVNSESVVQKHQIETLNHDRNVLEYFGKFIFFSTLVIKIPVITTKNTAKQEWLGIALSFRYGSTVYYYYYYIDGVVAQQVDHWTCDQQILGSNPTRGKAA